MALLRYIRTSDEQRIVSDNNLEVLEVFFPPNFDDEGDLGVGSEDAARPGAIATLTVGGETKIAVYQGLGEWVIIGEGAAAPVIDNTLTLSETSASLNIAYPDAKAGFTVISKTAGMKYIKIDSTDWEQIGVVIV